MTRLKKISLVSSAALLVALGGPAALEGLAPDLAVGVAFAQQGNQGGGGQGGGGGHEDGGESHDDGGGHEGGQQGGQGGRGQGGPSSEAGPGNQPASPGQGGPGEDSEGRGPQAGQMGQGDSGGKPVWAQEGVPEVELGRLSVARSPDHVLERALDEVLATWNPAYVDVYNLTAEQFAGVAAASWDTIALVDSPLQNLALLEALYAGELNLTELGVTPASTTDLAAIFLGVASDKTLPITTDTVIALNVIMDLGLDATQAAELAAMAEAVRQAVQIGHG
jgi:hypothetical protein